jgi:hypothetical protein
MLVIIPPTKLDIASGEREEKRETEARTMLFKC